MFVLNRRYAFIPLVCLSLLTSSVNTTQTPSIEIGLTVYDPDRLDEPGATPEITLVLAALDELDLDSLGTNADLVLEEHLNEAFPLMVSAKALTPIYRYVYDPAEHEWTWVCFESFTFTLGLKAGVNVIVALQIQRLL